MKKFFSHVIFRRIILGVCLPLLTLIFTNYYMFKYFEYKNGFEKERYLHSNIPYFRVNFDEEEQEEIYKITEHFKLDDYNSRESINKEKIKYKDYQNSLTYFSLEYPDSPFLDELLGFCGFITVMQVMMLILFILHVLRTINIIYFFDDIKKNKSYFQSKSFLFFVWFNLSHLLDIIILNGIALVVYFIYPHLPVFSCIVFTVLLLGFGLFKIITTRDPEKSHYEETKSLFGIRDVIENFIEGTFNRKERLETLKNTYTKNIF